MPMDKETKFGILVITLFCGIAAIPMTEWTEGHPIGSFFESFVAVALCLASFGVSALLGIRTKLRLDHSKSLYRASTFAAWIVGIGCFIACYFIIIQIPGLSDAFDRIS